MANGNMTDRYVTCSTLRQPTDRRLSRRQMLVQTVFGSAATMALGSSCRGADSPVTLDASDFLSAQQRVAVAAGRAEVDCTANLQAAIIAAAQAGTTLRIAAGTYPVSTLTITGTGFAIETAAGTSFRQRRGLDPGKAHPVFIITAATDVTIGKLVISGNIDSDRDEYNHAVQIGASKRVAIAEIIATDIRGDGIYCYGRTTTDTERLDQLHVGKVSGGNVFRNLVTVVGGNVTIDEVVNAGPVGFRDIDVEPNAEGSYQPVSLSIGRAQIGCMEITSDDQQLVNSKLQVRDLDADGRRIKAPSVPYPRAPGRSAYALGISHVDVVHIENARLRNYASYAVNLGARWRSVNIDRLDVAACCTEEKTFNAVIVQQKQPPSGAVLGISTIVCVHADNSKWLLHSDQPGLATTIGGGSILGGLLAVHCKLDARDLSIDAGGANGRGANILVSCSDSRLERITIRNAEQAALLYNSSDCSVSNLNGNVRAILVNGGVNNRFLRSQINSRRVNGLIAPSG